VPSIPRRTLVLDQGVRSSETCRAHNESQPASHGHRSINSALDDKGQHRPKPVHLPLGQIVARVACKSREENSLDTWRCRQGLSDLHCSITVSAHSDRQCLQSPQCQPAIKRRRHASLVLLDHAQWPFKRRGRWHDDNPRPSDPSVRRCTLSPSASPQTAPSSSGRARLSHLQGPSRWPSRTCAGS